MEVKVLVPVLMTGSGITLSPVTAATLSAERVPQGGTDGPPESGQEGAA